jgi:hypothetical protein
MSLKKLGVGVSTCLLIAMVSVSLPPPIDADGGLLVPYELWANVREGQQIAVVRIMDRDYAQVDLFISILDSTGDSHEVTFFVPLGTKTSHFNAVEKDLLSFDDTHTRFFDTTLRESATTRQRALQVLFAGALLTNGAILVPLWAPVLLSGCGAVEPRPEVTLQTESSQTDIYGIQEDTDLNALIQTTGLPAAVMDTLAKLTGQQIAVVKLQTQPGGRQETGTEEQWRPYSEPGLHLTWVTSLLPAKGGTMYSYPLGTGGAWSMPIEMTRVYITAQAGLDYSVKYPKLGSNKSGYDLRRGSNIYRHYDTAAYAVDEARGEFGRIWRGIYTQSNPADDIVITVKPQSVYSRFLAWIEADLIQYSVFFAVVIGLLVWVLAWRFLMHRFLSKDKEPYPQLNWVGALYYPCVNLLLMIIPGSILYFLFLSGIKVLSLAIVFLIMGGLLIIVFTTKHGDELGVSRGRALAAFVLTSLCGSGTYLVLALAFAWLVNAV